MNLPFPLPLRPRRWLPLLLPLLLLLLLGGHAHAAIKHNSCTHVATSATAWYYFDLPAERPAGFVLAKRGLIVDYRYTKTGTGKDELLTGAAWVPLGTFNSTYHSMDVDGLPGVGIRISAIRDPGVYYGRIGNDGMNFSTATIVDRPGTNLSLTEYYVQELVLTDPKKFKGGQAISVQAWLQTALISRFTLNAPSVETPPACNTMHTLFNQDIISIGGGTPEPLPPPAQPTCTASSDSLNFSVNLPSVSLSELPQAGALSKGTAFTLQLTDCQAGAQPYITFTDANDRGNRGSDLSLSGDSQASGVGIRLMDGERTIAFGAEHSSVSASNAGQFAMGSASQDGQAIMLPLQAHYVRTGGSVKPGTVRAAAIVTIAYP